jgi:hypothetical protein
MIPLVHLLYIYGSVVQVVANREVTDRATELLLARYEI